MKGIYIMKATLSIITVLCAIPGCCLTNGNIHVMDCSSVEGLCMGQTYDISCYMPSDEEHFYGAIKINRSHPCNAARSSFIRHFDKVGSTECNDIPICGGRFCGELRRWDPSMVLKMNVTTTKNLSGATIECVGISEIGEIMASCPVTFAIAPEPPVDLQITKSPSIITWNSPKLLRGQADQNLEYHVTVLNSLSSSVKDYNVNQQMMALPQEPTKGIVMYNICVSAKNCAGHSVPICTEITLGDSESLMPPSIKATTINGSAIEVEWTSKDSDIEGVCYDVEVNFMVRAACIPGNHYIASVDKQYGVYNIRVRKVFKDLRGEWSELTCMAHSPATVVTFRNHTVFTNTTTGMATVTVAVQSHTLQLGNCDTLPSTQIQIFNGENSKAIDLEQYDESTVVTMDIPYQSKITLTNKAVNLVGVGPIILSITFICIVIMS